MATWEKTSFYDAPPTKANKATRDRVFLDAIKELEIAYDMDKSILMFVQHRDGSIELIGSAGPQSLKEMAEVLKVFIEDLERPPL